MKHRVAAACVAVLAAVPLAGVTSAVLAGSAQAAGEVAPDPPTAVAAVRGDAQAVVSWTAPVFDGGSPITGYTVTPSSGLSTCSPATPATTTCTVTGLTNGTPYTFTVVATNAIGDSLPSAASLPVTPVGPPGTPVLDSATAGDGTAILAFTGAPSDGGQALYSYWGTCTSPGEVDRSGNLHNLGLGVLIVKGLTPGHTYSCSMRASNGVLFGPRSNALDVASDGAPGAPTAVTVTPGNGHLTFSWAPPAANGGTPVTGYAISCSHIFETTVVTDTVIFPSTSPATVTGLVNGVQYTCKLSASNVVGQGSAVTRKMIPITLPDVVPSATFTPLDGSIAAAWTVPASNGFSPITHYVVTCTAPGDSTSITVGGSARKTTIPLRTNGVTYTCSVAAINKAGTGPSSPTGTATPLARPTAPTGLVVTAGSQSVTLTYVAPSGRTVTSYVGTCTSASGPVSVTVSGSTTTITITGLSSGIAYTCSVTAVNPSGSARSVLRSVTVH